MTTHHTLAACVIALAILSLAAASPASAQVPEDPFASRLQAAGIQVSSLTVARDAALVVYEKPGPTGIALLTWLSIMGIAVEEAPQALRIVIEARTEGQPQIRVTVASNDVRAALSGSLQIADLYFRLSVEDLRSSEEAIRMAVVAAGVNPRAITLLPDTLTVEFFQPPAATGADLMVQWAKIMEAAADHSQGRERIVLRAHFAQGPPVEVEVSAHDLASHGTGLIIDTELLARVKVTEASSAALLPMPATGPEPPVLPGVTPPAGWTPDMPEPSGPRSAATEAGSLAGWDPFAAGPPPALVPQSPAATVTAGLPGWTPEAVGPPEAVPAAPKPPLEPTAVVVPPTATSVPPRAATRPAGSPAATLRDGDARSGGSRPPVIAYANTQDTPPPGGVSVTDSGGNLWRFHQWIALRQPGQWLQATTPDATVVGVQFWGDQNDGAARVLVDGRQAWRGSIYGSDANYPGGAFVKYLEIAGLTPGPHTVRVECLGQPGDGGGSDVTVFFFGFGNQ